MGAKAYGIDLGEVMQTGNRLALQRYQIGAFKKQEAADSALSKYGADIVNPDKRQGALAGIATEAPSALPQAAELIDKFSKLDDDQRKRVHDIYTQKVGVLGQTVFPLKGLPPEQRQQALTAQLPALKAAGFTDDELQHIDLSDEGITRAAQTTQTVRDQMAQINNDRTFKAGRDDAAALAASKAADDKQKDSNSPFNTDGTPNTDYQDYEVKKAGAAARARAEATQGGPGGAGRTITERYTNTLINGDPASPEYGAAYAYLSKPRVLFDPQTGEQISITPDMAWARRPGQQGSPGQAPQGAGDASASPQANQIPVHSEPSPAAIYPREPTSRAPGQPTITAAPGRSAAPARATFEANVNQAQSDIAVAERMFLPSGQFDRAMAMTGAAGIPLTQGREASQAIRRAVEIILRLRTGAAVPEPEVNNYVKMFAPSALDNESAARTKMDRLKQFFDDSRRVAGSKIPGADSGAGDRAGNSQADPLSQARDALARGADRSAVIQRLQQNGIDPGGL